MKLATLEGSFVINGERVYTSPVYGEANDYSSVSLDHVENREELERAVDDVLEGRKQAAEIEAEISGRWLRVSLNIAKMGLSLVANHIKDSNHSRDC